MTRRSRAREVALQLLVWRDMNPTAPAESVDRFVHDRLRDPIHEPFARRIYDGVIAQQSEIDAAIVAAAENWRLPRMPAVDRNVLRIGVFEMRDTADSSPPAVVINEAIELARRYGSADSPAFVNGVLDQIRNQEAVIGDQSSVIGEQVSESVGSASDDQGVVNSDQSSVIGDEVAKNIESHGGYEDVKRAANEAPIPPTPDA